MVVKLTWFVSVHSYVRRTSKRYSFETEEVYLDSFNLPGGRRPPKVVTDLAESTAKAESRAGCGVQVTTRGIELAR
jgi:hypothetical protein